MMEDKKKTYRALAGLANEPRVMPAFDPPSFRRINSAATNTVSTLPHPGAMARQQSVPTISSNGKISTHTGMDVVLANGGKRLSSRENIVGNNRLEVMLRLQKGRYKDLIPAEQAKVARDLVRAVCQYWGGRILVEQELSYATLDSDQSVAAMKALLCPESADAAVPVAVSSSSKPLLSSAPPVPDFLKNASMEMLGNNGGAENMQSAAVKSLQQRKAKRAIAKNLGSGRSVPDSFPCMDSLNPATYGRKVG
jgi:hypothetical protein